MIRPFLAPIFPSLLAAPLSARAQSRRTPQIGPAQFSKLRQAAQRRRSPGQLAELRGLLRGYIPYFKVPATVLRRVVCELDAATRTLHCQERQGERATCPTEVELRIEGSNAPARVPATCVGPINGFECECEFAGNRGARRG